MSNRLTVTSTKKAQSDIVKRQLLLSMHEQQSIVMKSLSDFYKGDIHDRSDYIALAKSVVAAVDEILKSQDYEESLFLRNTVKPLKAIREQAFSLLKQIDEQETSSRTIPTLEADMEPVYVLLFQSDGQNMQKWEQLLRGLSRYALGRPVYQAEADARKVIRTKMTDGQEAYVKVAVPKSLLEASERLSPRQDRFGNVLVTLPVGAIKSDTILEFVHGKKRYHFDKGELIDVSTTAESDRSNL